MARRKSTWLADKIVGLRVFEDEAGKMNLSLAEVGGGDARDQPVHAVWRLPARASAEFYGCGGAGVGGAALRRFVEVARRAGVEVATGKFREHMLVSLVNDGPVTLWIDTAEM